MANDEFKRRGGTASILGQLYETKLTALIHFRMKYDDEIFKYYIASNMDGVGEFDDICFMLETKDIAKPIAVFLQAKHRENENRPMDITASDYAKFFNNYLKIKSKFNNDSDVLFKKSYDDVECFFVFYTNTSNNFENETYPDTEVIKKINSVIRTGRDGAQLSYLQTDLNLLYSVVLDEKIKKLATLVAKIVQGQGEDIMNEELIQTHHVVLSQKVFHVSDIGGYRFGSFRDEFFLSTEKHLLLLKNILFLEVLKTIKPNTKELKENLQSLFNSPTPTTISKLIGCVICMNNKNKFEFVNKKLKNDKSLTQKLQEVNVSPSVVDEAINIAGREKLNSNILKFRLPPEFGKSDMSMDADHLTNQNQDFPNHIFKFNEEDISLVKDFTKRMLFYTNQRSQDGIEKELRHGVATLESGKRQSNFQLKSDAIYLKYYDQIEKWSLSQTTETYLTKNCNFYENAKHGVLTNALLSVTNLINRNRILKHDITFKAENVNLKLNVTTSKVTFLITESIDMSVLRLIQYYKDKYYFLLDLDYILNLPYGDFHQLVYEIKNNSEKIFILTCNTTSDVSEIRYILEQLHGMQLIVVTNPISLKEMKPYFRNTEIDIVHASCILNDLTRESQNKILENTNVIFQGIQVCLKFLLDDVSKAYIQKELINKIINRETILLGEEIIDEKYKEIKNYYIERKVMNTYYSPRKLTKLYFINTRAKETCNINRNLIKTYRKVTKSYCDSRNAMSTSHLSRKVTKTYRKSMKACRSVIKGIHRREKRKRTRTYYVRRNMMKIYYFSTKLQITNVEKKVKSFYDIDDRTVLITGEPGMGKSLLLTHLGLKTKTDDPKVWIIRISLLNHSSSFREWKDKCITIKIIDALKFICIALVNKKRNKHLKNKKIFLNATKTEILLDDRTEIKDPEVIFELRMFLHYYNKYKVIFLFDGFDEICPHYEKQVIAFLKVLRDSLNPEHRIWVTSRPYNSILKNLRREFAEPYILLPFSKEEHEMFVNRFLETSIKWSELNKKHLNNISNFFEFMKSLDWMKHTPYRSHIFQSPTYIMYTMHYQVAKYFSNEVQRIIHLEDSYTKIWNLTDLWIPPLQYTSTKLNVPLHKYLLVNQVLNLITDSENDPKWDLNFNSVAIYDSFIETKFKKIRFQEKNKWNLDIPDIILSYQRDLKDFKYKHKILAAYVIFFDDKKVLFDETELEYTKTTIDAIKLGEEKTGLITNIIADFPQFLHMSFAEYFAVEYVTDILKKNLPSTNIKLQFLWRLLLRCYLNRVNNGLMNMLDIKLKTDEELNEIISGESSRKLIFQMLIEVFTEHAYFFFKNSSHNVLHYDWQNLLGTPSGKAKNLLVLLVSTLEFFKDINEIHLKVFKDILRTSRKIPDFEVCLKYINLLFDAMKVLDEVKLGVLSKHCPKNDNYSGEFSEEDLVVIFVLIARLFYSAP